MCCCIGANAATTEAAIGVGTGCPCCRRIVLVGFRAAGAEVDASACTGTLSTPISSMLLLARVFVAVVGNAGEN